METLYYVVVPQKWDIDGEFVDNGMKNIRVYDINTQDMTMIVFAEIESYMEAESEFEIQTYLDNNGYGDVNYNFEQL